MQADWEKFIKSLPHEVVFFHKNEFHKQHPDQKDVRLPAAFIEDASGLKLLIPHAEINRAESVGDLIEIVKQYLPK
jgi:hypothetical protein